MTVETVTLTQTETVVATQGSGNVIETVDVPVVVVTGLLGSPGPQGPAGPIGPQGVTGTSGASSVSQLTDVNLTGLTDESVLVYETDVSQWIATTQIVTYDRSLTLQTDWIDTGIEAAMLQTGTYFIQLIADDTGFGINGTNNNEYYSGIMSWYSGATNSSLEMPTDEIALHRAGAGGEGGLFLRTYRSPTGNSRKLRLQIYSNTATNGYTNYKFKFKRIM
jgi:hypothetical protein